MTRFLHTWFYQICINFDILFLIFLLIHETKYLKKCLTHLKYLYVFYKNLWKMKKTSKLIILLCAIPSGFWFNLRYKFPLFLYKSLSLRSLISWGLRPKTKAKIIRTFFDNIVLSSSKSVSDKNLSTSSWDKCNVRFFLDF